MELTDEKTYFLNYVKSSVNTQKSTFENEV